MVDAARGASILPRRSRWSDRAGRLAPDTRCGGCDGEQQAAAAAVPVCEHADVVRVELAGAEIAGRANRLSTADAPGGRTNQAAGLFAAGGHIAEPALPCGPSPRYRQSPLCRALSHRRGPTAARSSQHRCFGGVEHEEGGTIPRPVRGERGGANAPVPREPPRPERKPHRPPPHAWRGVRVGRMRAFRRRRQRPPCRPVARRRQLPATSSSVGEDPALRPLPCGTPEPVAFPSLHRADVTPLECRDLLHDWRAIVRSLCRVWRLAAGKW